MLILILILKIMKKYKVMNESFIGKMYKKPKSKESEMYFTFMLVDVSDDDGANIKYESTVTGITNETTVLQMHQEAHKIALQICDEYNSKQFHLQLDEALKLIKNNQKVLVKHKEIIDNQNNVNTKQNTFKNINKSES